MTPNRTTIATLLATWALAGAAADSATPAPGTLIQDCAQCPQMVVVPAGRFMMGSDNWREHEKPVHEVHIPRSFAIGRTAVTQAQWIWLMGKNPSRYPRCGKDCALDWVSWDDAQLFIERLSAHTGQRYRLPTEAEWEYACRAGGTHQYCGGDDVHLVARIWKKGQRNGPWPVAGKAPNAWGLYDMTGNIGEWTLDCWNPSYAGAPADGSAWTSGDCRQRSIRGNNRNATEFQTNAANRGRGTTDYRSSTVGFRLVRELP
jgi:formylglycine-generating enzyme required for sulfatase activity